MNCLPVFDGLGLTAVVDRNHCADSRDLSYLFKINDKN
jgi:hypothetical protein